MDASSFPVALQLRGRTCLVVGQSEETARRLDALLRAGAHIRWLVPPSSAAPCPESLRVYTCHPQIERLAELPHEAHLDGVWLVVLTDRDPTLAPLLAGWCERRRLFFCAVDQPAGNTYAHMGLAQAGPLQLAIGTDGAAPALARRLKLELQRLFDAAQLGRFVGEMAAARLATPAADRPRVMKRWAERLRFEGRLVIDAPDEPGD